MWVENNKLENLNDQNNQLSELKDILWKNEWFEDFKKLFDSLDQTQRDKFLTVIKNNPNAKNYYDFEEWEILPNIDEKNKFDEFIEKYWKDVIINLDFNKDISIKTDEETKKEDEETKIKERKENESKIDKLLTLKTKSEEIKEDYKEFFTDEIIKKTKESDDYLKWLENNKDKTVELYIIEKNYKELLQKSLQKDIENKVSPTDKKSNSYKLFSQLQALEDSWLNIQAELTFKLLLAEHSPDNSISSTKTSLARLSIDTSEYHKTEIHWDILVYWDQVVNLATNEKFIKSKLWYLLKSSDLEFKEGREYQERIDKTNDEVKWIDKEIKSNNEKIWAVNNLAKLDLLSDELFKKVDNDIRKKIEKFSDEPNNEQLKQEIVNDIKEYIKKLVSIFEKQNKELSERKDKLSESLIKLKEDYEKSEKQFKSKLEKKDKMQRESIKFINRIALDVIPQNLLNRLIDMLKSNMIIIPGLDIDRQAINLENQQFWNSVTVENETLWERNLIKFLNKLVYWEINPKDTIFKEDEIIKNPKFNIRPSTMRFTLESKDLMGSDWFHINKMIQNLRKVEKSK